MSWSVGLSEIFSDELNVKAQESFERNWPDASAEVIGQFEAALDAANMFVNELSAATINANLSGHVQKNDANSRISASVEKVN